MVISQVLSAVDTRYPNAYQDQVKIVHLIRVENMARREIYALPMLVSVLTESTALIIPSPYDGIYEHYLTAMLAQMDGEYTRYNAEMGLYAALWNALLRSRRREVLPECPHRVTRHV